MPDPTSTTTQSSFGYRELLQSWADTINRYENARKNDPRIWVFKGSLEEFRNALQYNGMDSAESSKPDEILIGTDHRYTAFSIKAMGDHLLIGSEKAIRDLLSPERSLEILYDETLGRQFMSSP